MCDLNGISALVNILGKGPTSSNAALALGNIVLSHPSCGESIVEANGVETLIDVLADNLHQEHLARVE